MRALSAEALFVDVTGDRSKEVRRQGESCESGFPLTIIDSPHRELIGPMRDYSAKLVEHDEYDRVTVILPEDRTTVAPTDSEE